MTHPLKTKALLFLLTIFATTNALAALASNNEMHVIYEKIEQFSKQSNLSVSLQIDEAGIYLATLTDHENPFVLQSLGLEIIDTLGSLGSLNGAGAFTFEAGIGEHVLNMFAIAANRGDAQSAWLQKWKTEKRERYKALTRTERDQRADIWWALTDQERHDRYQKNKARQIALFEKQFSDQGEYGVEIEWHDNVTVHSAEAVPIPGAAWLFGSGLLGLIGFARNRRKN